MEYPLYTHKAWCRNARRVKAVRYPIGHTISELRLEALPRCNFGKVNGEIADWVTKYSGRDLNSPELRSLWRLQLHTFAATDQRDG